MSCLDAMAILARYDAAILTGDRAKAARALKEYDQHREACPRCHQGSSAGWPVGT